ncbi:MAG: hypothetical protein ACYDAQ_11220, partial [Mycobacteriales bacterium]
MADVPTGLSTGRPAGPLQGEGRGERLAAARLYLCIGERPDLAATVRAAVAAGVDIVQFREKGAEWRTEMAGLALLR